jgi:hypothetical protein
MGCFGGRANDDRLWARDHVFVLVAYPNGPAGVFQRIAIIAYFTWFSLLALHFSRVRWTLARRSYAAARSPVTSG